ncbi:MAG: hypothetical protein C5B52_10355 [Bacteroidetes bacterium]|nr:MAG: hypothetical protein C5B52_10355 [Bacteroidota bacterium]
MHEIEPFYNWRHLYTAETDEFSPFFGREYSEFEYSQTVYNYYIHPQWDEFGSRTLYMKILYADYEQGFVIIELIGEWNDAIENDIMTLRREVTDFLFTEGITKFILIAENVLNFHSSDDSYYEDWFQELEDENGWVVILNMPEQSQHDFRKAHLDRYVELLEYLNWRTLQPQHLFNIIDNHVSKRLPED